MLDHILAPPALVRGGSPPAAVPGSGRIEHDAWAAQIDGDGAKRDQRATDHRPAALTLTHP